MLTNHHACLAEVLATFQYLTGRARTDATASAIRSLNVGNTSADVAGFRFVNQDEAKMPKISFVNKDNVPFTDCVHVGPASVFRPVSGAFFGQKRVGGGKTFVEEAAGKAIHQREQCEAGSKTAQTLEAWLSYEPFFDAAKDAFGITTALSAYIIVPTPIAAALELRLQADAYEHSKDFPGMLLNPLMVPLPSIDERIKATPRDKSVHHHGKDTYPQRKDARVCPDISAFPISLERIVDVKGVKIVQAEYDTEAPKKLLAEKYTDVVNALFGSMARMNITPHALESLTYCAPVLQQIIKELPEIDIRLFANFLYSIKDNVYGMKLPKSMGPDLQPLSLRVRWELERNCPHHLTPLVAFTMSPACWKTRDQKGKNASIAYDVKDVIVLGLVDNVVVSRVVAPDESRVAVDDAVRMALVFADSTTPALAAAPSANGAPAAAPPTAGAPASVALDQRQADRTQQQTESDDGGEDDETAMEAAAAAYDEAAMETAAAVYDRKRKADEDAQKKAAKKPRK